MSKEQKVGIFVVLALAILMVFLELTTGYLPFRKTYALYGLFKDAKGVTEGSDVWISGINVARVKTVRLKEGGAEVRLAMPKNVILYKDAMARIEPSLFGTTATLSIIPGSPSLPPLTDGDYIKTEETVSFGQILARIDSAAESIQSFSDSFGIGKEGLLGKITDFFEKHEQDLDRVVINLSSFMQKINKGEGTLAKLIEDDDFYNKLINAVDSLNKAAQKFEKGEGTLAKLMDDDLLYNESVQLIKKLNSTVNDLSDIASKINKGEGTLGKLVADSSLYDKAEESLANIDRATKGMEDQGPISAIGAVVGGLF